MKNLEDKKSEGMPFDANAASIDDAAQAWFIQNRESMAAPDQKLLSQFQSWLDADPRHKAAYDEVADLWESMGELAKSFAPSDQLSNTDVTLQVAPKEGWWKKFPSRHLFSSPRPIHLGFVTACLLVLMSPALLDLPVMMNADHTTGVGEQATIELSDGSVAVLNTDSAISISYTEADRKISLLKGEVFFEVATDSGRPFKVQALEGTATAVGTAFAVKHNDTTATVSVTEGVVRVSTNALPTQSSAAHDSVTLLAGEAINYAAGEAPGPIEDIDATSTTAWRTGVISIHEQALDEALEEIDRYRVGKLFLLADADQIQPVTAQIAVDNIDSGVEALAETHGLTVTHLTDYLVVIR